MDVIAADAVQRFAFTTDAGIGARARIGLVVLATDATIEHEYRLLLNLPGVAIYESRILTMPTSGRTRCARWSRSLRPPPASFSLANGWTWSASAAPPRQCCSGKK